MTRPPPPRRHTGPALAACGLLGVTALGLLTAHGITASAAVRRPVTVDGAIPGPATAVTTASGNTLSAISSHPSAQTVTVYPRAAAERVRTITAPQRTIVERTTATVTATATATRTITATSTATVTATETVTLTPSISSGVSP